MSIKGNSDNQIIEHDDQSSFEDDTPLDHVAINMEDEVDIPLFWLW